MYKNRGFTLIELLVVITILGMLASSVLAATSSSRASGRDASQENEIKQIQNALELHRTRNATYPCFSPSGTGCLQVPINLSGGSDPADFIFGTTIAPFYDTSPSDSPGWNVSLYYVGVLQGNAYRITARFERPRTNNAGVTIAPGTWCRVDQGNVPSGVPGSSDPLCF